MAKQKSLPSSPPPLVENWIQSTPLPILMLGEGEVVVACNEAFSELLLQEQTDASVLIRNLLSTPSEPVEKSDTLLEVLKPNQCVVKRVSLAGGQQYVFHGVKLVMQEGRWLCCTFMPGSDPSHTHLEGILNTIATFVVEFDSKGNIRYINDQFLAHLRYERSARDTLRQLQQIQPAFTAAKLTRRLEDVRQYGVAQFRSVFITQKGTETTLEVCIVPNQTPGDSTFLLTGRDIDLLLAHEQALREELKQAQQVKTALERENIRLQSYAARVAAASKIVHRSELMREVMDRIQQVAPVSTNVLVTGEGGVGKELIARTIHRLSGRASGSFVAVDCSSLPPELMEMELFGYQPGAFSGAYRERKGRFEAAAGGTIYLEEVGDLPLFLQSRLLRFLETGAFSTAGNPSTQRADVRMIASTTQDLSQLVERGRFRADLYYQLTAYHIAVTPLRERKEDISVLIDHFVKRYNEKFSRDMVGPSQTTLSRLRRYDFPGNVTELEIMVEQALSVSDGDGLEIVAPSPVAPVDRPVLDLIDGQLTELLSFDDYQRKYIQLVLERTGGKVSGEGGAAEILKMNAQTLFSKMRRLGLRK